MSRLLCACLLGASVSFPAAATDWSPCPNWDAKDGYTVFASPYTHHWSDENASQHQQVLAASVSRRLPNDRFCGFSLFRNSFGQPSAYAFTGWSWNQLFQTPLYLNVTAGIIYGYVGEHREKVPLNVNGFSPVVIPSLGYQLTPQLGVEVQILGTAAVMFGASWRF